MEKIKLNKKGLSTIVGTLLIVLLTIIGVGVLWAVVGRNTEQAISGQSPDCFTLDLEPISCGYGNGCYQVSPTQRFNIPNMVWISPLRRNEGDGELESVILVVKDSSGNIVAAPAIDRSFPEVRYHFEKDLSELKELETIEVGATFPPWPNGVVPVQVQVSTVVKGGIVCPVSTHTASCVSLESINVPTC